MYDGDDAAVLMGIRAAMLVVRASPLDVAFEEDEVVAVVMDGGVDMDVDEDDDDGAIPTPPHFLFLFLLVWLFSSSPLVWMVVRMMEWDWRSRWWLDRPS